MQRFWKKVIKTDGCWLWTGYTNADGYGRFRDENGSLIMVHRYSYQQAYGPIPPGLTIDHVRARGCMSRACVRPSHLEAVTHAENVARGTHWNRIKTECPQGHPYDEANTYVDKRGKRYCRTCRRETMRRRRASGVSR